MTQSPDRYERWVRRADGPMLVLAVLFLAVFLVPLFDPTLPRATRVALQAASGVLWAAFAADYAMRLWLAPDRRRYVRMHVPDLLAVALPLLRPLRVLRLVGLFGAATRRAGRHAQARVTAVLVLMAVLVMVTAAALVLDAERASEDANITSAGDAFWWAATTVTTVGYGDRFPVTRDGRLAAVALMVTGIALLGVLTASVAAWFVKRFTAIEQFEVEVERDAATNAAGLIDLSARLERIERQLVRLLPAESPSEQRP